MITKIIKRLGRTLFAATLAVFAASSHAAGVPESSDPIKLAINEWTGQHVTTYVAGEILKKMGYNVEYVTAGYYPQFIAMKDNNVTAALEVWLSNAGDHYHKGMDNGSIISIGDLNLKGTEGWYYPKYVEELCPGLPDWSALKNCAEVLAAADTFPQGRLVDYPTDWGTTNVDRINALKLDFVSVPSGSEGALITVLQSATAKKEPLLMQFWTPHWLHAVSEMGQVVLPPYEENCEEDPSVGPDPNVTYDCAWPSKPIMKIAWPGMPDKWPTAYKFLQNYEMTNDAQIPMLKAVDADGGDALDVSKAWVDANEAVWKPWVDAAMN